MEPRTEAEFVLPFGYRDAGGTVHRSGALRIPNQKDLTVVLKQAGEVDNPAYLETLMLCRVLVRLGDVPLTDANRQDVVESLLTPDVEYLNRVFARLLAQSPPPDEVACPSCGHRWLPPAAGPGPEAPAGEPA